MDTTNICGIEKTADTQEKVNLEYQGFVTQITVEEFEALQKGEITFKEMFG